MEREFNNLHHLRSIGFTGYPHYVARPLGHNGSLDCVLVEEFCFGTPLTDFIVKAIREGAREPLFQKLTALAYFLATFLATLLTVIFLISPITEKKSVRHSKKPAQRPPL